MREHRWESQTLLDLPATIKVGERLSSCGLTPASPNQDLIAYLEDWAVHEPSEIHRLDPWPLEDLTLIHTREGWKGDFFLLAGSYHTVFEGHRTVDTYCSISHPWSIHKALRKHHSDAMFWLGFRHGHSFIRVRLQTTEIIAPGEPCGADEHSIWLEERREAFARAITLLGVPIELRFHNGSVTLESTQTNVPFFCSWADAFGPCQFEFNSSDSFEFLVPASQLAATFRGPCATVRTYLTGFTLEALQEFHTLEPATRYTYRCSAHSSWAELPELLDVLRPTGRLYTSVCEFQPSQILPGAADASVIIGVIGSANGFQVEARFNRRPFPHEKTEAWLEDLLGLPMTYVPLPAFS